MSEEELINTVERLEREKERLLFALKLAQFKGHFGYCAAVYHTCEQHTKDCKVATEIYERLKYE